MDEMAGDTWGGSLIFIMVKGLWGKGAGDFGNRYVSRCSA